MLRIFANFPNPKGPSEQGEESNLVVILIYTVKKLPLGKTLGTG